HRKVHVRPLGLRAPEMLEDLYVSSCELFGSRNTHDLGSSSGRLQALVMRISISCPLSRVIFWWPWKAVVPSPPAPPTMEPIPAPLPPPKIPPSKAPAPAP